ncbi:hypothetical protein Tco_1456514 [Tanacetum coccineum]
MPVGKGRRDEGVFNRLGAKKRVRSHTRKAATRVPASKERNLSPENVIMKARVHKGQRCSPKVKTARGGGETLVERWAMPTLCHMFNFTLTGSARVWFDDLPPEFVDSNDDLKRHS